MLLPRNSWRTQKVWTLGWNIPCSFSVPDLSISLDSLNYLLKNEWVPYKMLNYCGGECNYEGASLMTRTVRCIRNILVDFFTIKVQNDKYRFSKSGIFYASPKGDHASYVKYIRSLPLAEGPECYGLHDSAAITSSILETSKLLSTALSLLPRDTGGAAMSWENNSQRQLKLSQIKYLSSTISRRFAFSTQQYTRIPATQF